MLAEESRSLDESCAWFLRLAEASTPIICECCGTSVVMVPEALAADGPARAYRPAIWECGPRGLPGPGPVRKHTLRRCTWIRDHQ